MDERSARLSATLQILHRLDDGRIMCDLCPRDCKLHEGQRGACFVRAVNDEMVLTTYGRSSGFASILLKRNRSTILSGQQHPVVRHGGCNLACKFCQNWIFPIAQFRQVGDQATRRPLRTAPKSWAARASRSLQ